MEIRSATSADARAIAEIHVAGWRTAYRDMMPDAFLAALSVDRREDGWHSAIAGGMPRILVAVESGRVVGWIAFDRCRDSDQPRDTGEIWALYVGPEYISRGVGRSLWLAAQAALVAAGFRRVTLWVLAANERACRFYQTAGFIEDPSSRRPTEFDGFSLDEIRLVSAVAG